MHLLALGIWLGREHLSCGRKNSANDFPKRAKVAMNFLSPPAQHSCSRSKLLSWHLSKTMRRCSESRRRPLCQRKRQVKFKERSALLPQSPREVLHMYLFADFLDALCSESYFLGNHPRSNICVQTRFLYTCIPLGIARAFPETAHVTMPAQVLPHQAPPS